MSEAAKIALPVVMLALGAAAYFTGNLPETFAGTAIVTLAWLLPAPLAARALVPLAPKGPARLAMVASALLCVAISAAPLFNALYPGAPAFTATLSKPDGTADGQSRVDWQNVTPGPYTLLMETTLVDRQGEVNAPYQVQVGEQLLKGAFWKRTEQVRVGKSATATSENVHNFERHRITVSAGSAKVALTDAAPEIITPVKLTFYPTTLPLWLFLAITVLALLLGAFFEAKHANEKNKSVLTTAIAFTSFFAYMFPDQVTTQAIVKPAAGSVIASGLVGLAIGGVVSWVARRAIVGKVKTDPDVSDKAIAR